MSGQKCKRCSYHGHASIMGIICEYILCTGKMRPCPAGAGCTVFTTEPVHCDEEMWSSGVSSRKAPALIVSEKPLPASEPKPEKRLRRRKIDREELLRLKLEGKSDSQCAMIFGCKQPSVTRMKIAFVKEGLLPESMHKPHKEKNSKEINNNESLRRN